MKQEDLIAKKMAIAEKAIRDLTQSGDLKKLTSQAAEHIAQFYELKSLNRLQTAKHIYAVSQHPQHSQLPSTYTDYGESVAAAYYSMYYIVHAYLAALYQTKLREDLRGVHAITHHIVLYYLVQTKKLANYLYDEYTKTLETTSALHHITLDTFQEKAYALVETYNKNREARERFTYNITPSIEAYHAEHALKYAEEFIHALRQLILKH